MILRVFVCIFVCLAGLAGWGGRRSRALGSSVCWALPKRCKFPRENRRFGSVLAPVVFDYEMALKSPPANETLSSNRAWECRNIDYFIGFIYSHDVEAKIVISCKC